MAVKHYTLKTYSPRNSVGYLVKVAHGLMLDRVTLAFDAFDLSFMQWMVLIRLKDGTDMTASDLCRSLRHDTGALTRLLDGLEERGYLTRERSREDRRVVYLKLTTAGVDKCDELTPVMVELLNKALADFSKDEFAELSRLLNKLIDAIRAEAAAGESK